MNRIRELRIQQRLTAAELARLVGTSQQQIARLESGERRLTEDWMRRISQALKVRPMDLLAQATLAEFQEEVVPFVLPGLPGVSGAMAHLALTVFQVNTDSMVGAGVKRGDIITINMSQQAVDNVRTGDVVVAQLYDKADPMRAVTVVRQFIAPDLLTTNHPGFNSCHSFDTPAFESRIKGVMVPSEPPPR